MNGCGCDCVDVEWVGGWDVSYLVDDNGPLQGVVVGPAGKALDLEVEAAVGVGEGTGKVGGWVD